VIAMKGMAVRPFQVRRWTRREYERAVELGLFHEDEKLELIDGQLLVAEPHNPPHATGIDLVADALRAVFTEGWRVRVQLPLALGELSEPEPDVAVVAGSPRDYSRAHPSRAVLVVEVADTSLRLDRTRKVAVYAGARVSEYWIVNVVDRVLEVHREPGREGRRWRYGVVQILGPEATITPLAAAQAHISVAALLP
jgi:Uma2 family endonuclease